MAWGSDGLIPPSWRATQPRIHGRRDQIAIASGPSLQMSNFGALGIATLAGIFLHWRERRKVGT